MEVGRHGGREASTQAGTQAQREGGREGAREGGKILWLATVDHIFLLALLEIIVPVN